MVDWYYEQGGSRHGPFSAEALKSLHGDGKISDASLVWHPDFGRSWKRFRDTAMAEDGGPPPLPVTHVSDVYAWLVALVPALGAIAERVLADVAPAVELSGRVLFPLYTFAYVVLCSLDGRQIKRSGRARDVALLGWVWFVPAYLVQRARALGTKQYLVFVWIAVLLGSVAVTSPDILKGTTYWGLGIPPCDSKSSQTQVGEIFDNVPAVKQAGLTGSGLRDIGETAKTATMRSCKATIAVSATQGLPITYTITDRKDGFYYEVSVGD